MPMARVNDVDIYYEVSGEGTPLVLSHSGWQDVSSWENQVPTFSQRYKTIAYDRRGCGRSQKEDISHSAELWVEDLHQLLLHLGIDKAYIGGISFGGMITLEFVLRYPEMVKGAIIASANSEGFTSSSEHTISFPRRTEELHKIQTPVLLIAGTQDANFSPSKAEIAHKGIAGSEIVVLDCGHSVGRERPEEFNSAVLAFLDRVESEA